jgi:hypothetical protein
MKVQLQAVPTIDAKVEVAVAEHGIGHDTSHAHLADVHVDHAQVLPGTYYRR